MHRALYTECRALAEGAARPAAAVIDSQSFESAKKGGRSPGLRMHPSFTPRTSRTAMASLWRWPRCLDCMYCC
jgi:hypothetical protein